MNRRTDRRTSQDLGAINQGDDNGNFVWQINHKKENNKRGGSLWLRLRLVYYFVSASNVRLVYLCGCCCWWVSVGVCVCVCVGGFCGLRFGPQLYLDKHRKWVWLLCGNCAPLRLPRSPFLVSSMYIEQGKNNFINYKPFISLNLFFFVKESFI